MLSEKPARMNLSSMLLYLAEYTAIFCGFIDPVLLPGVCENYLHSALQVGVQGGSDNRC